MDTNYNSPVMKRVDSLLADIPTHTANYIAEWYPHEGEHIYLALRDGVPTLHSVPEEKKKALTFSDWQGFQGEISFAAPIMAEATAWHGDGSPEQVAGAVEALVFWAVSPVLPHLYLSPAKAKLGEWAWKAMRLFVEATKRSHLTPNYTELRWVTNNLFDAVFLHLVEWFPRAKIAIHRNALRRTTQGKSYRWEAWDTLRFHIDASAPWFVEHAAYRRVGPGPASDALLFIKMLETGVFEALHLSPEDAVLVKDAQALVNELTN